jgi:23S rRNA pseudouridine1911/1915/1917 synthase
MKDYHWETGVDAAGERLDRWIEARLDGLSRSQIAVLIKDGRCVVRNGAGQALAARPGLFLAGGEVVTLTVPPVALPTSAAEDIPLSILHEDDHIVVVDKPAGMVVHPSPGHKSGTLVNALLGRYGQAIAAGFAAGDDHDEDAPAGGDPARLGLVHRLDAETSGVIVVARTAQALDLLQTAFRERRVRKRYLALVAGTPRADMWRSEGWIGRHPKDFKKRAILPEGEGDAREASTTFLVLHRGKGLSVLECRPRTGRTHQIRVHAAAAGHALLADPTYGRSRTWPIVPKPGEPVLSRHGLHAWQLEIPHPATGAMLHLAAPIPADLKPWLPAGVQPKPW